MKRIGLEGLKEEGISQLMREFDLVKRLSHLSIVKYEGMVRDENTSSIVLECLILFLLYIRVLFPYLPALLPACCYAFYLAHTDCFGLAAHHMCPYRYAENGSLKQTLKAFAN